MKIFDISLPIHEGMITYPGNPEVAIEAQKGKSSTVSKLALGSHTGTHLDVPAHVFEDGWGSDEVPLEALIGKCRVLDMAQADKAVTVDDLKAAQVQKDERILLKTANSARGFDSFYDDYVYLDGDAAEYLAEQGVLLVGIDSLSIKERGSSDTRPHTALLQSDILILEGLNLSAIEAGEYMLMCLPLALKGLDGAPCRAVLVTE